MYKIALIIILAITTFTTSAQTIKAVIKFDGITSGGDSNHDTYKGSEGWFDIISFASGVDKEVTQNPVTETRFNLASMTMPHNALQTDLLQKSAAGTPYTTAEIRYICTSCTAHMNTAYSKIELKTVYVAEIKMGTDADQLAYDVFLSFGAMRRTFTASNPSTGALDPNTTTIFQWNAVTNTNTY